MTLPRTMKAVVLTGHGGLDRLEWREDVPVPQPRAGEVLVASVGALEEVAEQGFVAASVQDALQTALVDGLGLKPRVAYGPLRVALSGRRVSPPLFESMELLGKQATIARLDALVQRIG